MIKFARRLRWILVAQWMLLALVALELPAQQSDADDYCLLFGDGQYAEAATQIIPLFSDFTVEMWIYDTGSGGFVEYISQGMQPGPFYLGTTAGSDIIRAGDTWVDTGVVMPKNRWVHIALTKSFFNSGALYLNGQLVSTNNNYTFGNGAGSPTRLGSQFGTPSEFFSGCMDEVKIFRSVRTASQIGNDMHKLSSASSDPNLIAYYDFNDQSDRNRITQASGSSSYPFELALPGEWTPATETITRLSISSEIGLSNCSDGNCGAYIDTDLLNISQGFRSGYSWYSAVWPLLTEIPDRHFQMGLGSTWLTPDLRQYEGQAALNNAIRNVCGDFGADRGNGQWILFQSIEGGLGYWVDTQFKSAMPKWRFNATSNCYHFMIGTPGWRTGTTTPLDMDETGLVQLSNRMLIAPDGQTFPLDTDGQLLGVSWIALPFPNVATTGDVSSTGPNAWTLFMNSANFKGPLAYWMPQYFSQASQSDPSLAPYGLDSNPGLILSMASEMGWISMIESTDANNTTYSRIPQLRFHVNDEGRSILSQDVLSYSESTTTTPFSAWLNGDTESFGPFSTTNSDVRKLSLRISHQPSYYQHNDEIRGLSDQLLISAFDSGTSYGISWNDPDSTGEFPTYFRDEGSTRRIVSEADVPTETGLRDYEFPSADKTVTYEPATWWNYELLSIPGGSITLTDGSTVEYVWFKFVDQPALRRLNLSAPDRAALQSMVENMHRTWSITQEYMAPPTSGELVSFDPALIVTPPPGYEYGYVPIAISQTGNIVGPPLE